VHHAIDEHPVVVAYKAEPNAREAIRRTARLEIVAPARVTLGSPVPVVVRVTNTGSRTWRAATPSNVGQVTLGVQVLEPDGRLLVRDHYREPLPSDVASDQQVELRFACPAPSRPGRYLLKFDMVAEGIAWFEAGGSPAETRPLDVTS